MASNIEFTVEGKAWRIGDFTDDLDEWTELCAWCLDQEGMSASMSVQANGRTVKLQVEGTNVATVYPTLNSYVVWNGFQLSTMTAAEYKRAHG